MDRFNITLRTAYWTINLCILLCTLNVITSLTFDPNGTCNILPKNWPDQWNDGIIPFVFNFYSLAGLKSLIRLVKKGHSYIEDRSCLIFKEHSPVDLARRDNFTYLYYSYSGVLESCCLQSYAKSVGRRMIIITPICTLPAEVGHVTLHGLGLTHNRSEPFSEYLTKELLFVKKCPDVKQKLKAFYSKI